ncbi:MAG: bifunctional riboflavin kinase/FAD synthetase [Leptospiraceae bacterium]|nr:bifunctional riboflavin kinase/FAD synthetase [Leptospiraceae bacterium]
MKILNFSEISKSHFPEGSVVTLGNFDGIHIGHDALIQKLKEVSHDLSIPGILVTYYPNPGLVLGKSSGFQYIYSEDQKLDILESKGIEYLLKIPFTLEFAHMPALEFLNDILINKLNAHHIIIGFNHCFGRDREGDYNFLLKNKGISSYEVSKIDQILLEKNEKISSSYVRSLIQSGQIERANQILSRNFSIRSKVQTGFRKGRELGFPTINQEIHPFQILPADGVYLTKTKIDTTFYPSLTNIGNRPTFDGVKRSLETHILNFRADLYDREVEVYYLKRLRDEQKFASVSELVAQLQRDKTQAESFFLNPALHSGDSLDGDKNE